MCSHLVHLTLVSAENNVINLVGCIAIRGQQSSFVSIDVLKPGTGNR